MLLRLDGGRSRAAFAICTTDRGSVTTSVPRTVDGGPVAKARSVSILALHLYVAVVIAALAVLAVWRRFGRRIALYALTVQIAIGIVLLVQGAKVPWYHAALAVFAWLGYMAANALSRRDPESRRALILSAISSVLVLLAYYVGMQAVKAGYTGG